MAVAAGRDDGDQEDEAVVGGVDQGGGGDGLGLDADQGEDQRDARRGPSSATQRWATCCGVEHGEEDAGEHGGEDEDAGERVVVVCQRVRASAVRGRLEPVVGDGEGGQQEAAEADLFEDGRDEDAEESDEPGGRLE